jgi:hypothetical protein
LTAEQREQLDALSVVPSGGDVETQVGVVTEFWSREQYLVQLRAQLDAVTAEVDTEVREISKAADWYLSADALKAASIDLVRLRRPFALEPGVAAGELLGRTGCASMCPSTYWRPTTATCSRVGA